MDHEIESRLPHGDNEEEEVDDRRALRLQAAEARRIAGPEGEEPNRKRLRLAGPVIEVDLDDDEAAADFEAGAAPIAITEDEASDNDDEVEFVGESRAVGANWVLRREHGPRLDQRALQALDRHLGFNNNNNLLHPPPVRVEGVRRYNTGNLPDLRDVDTTPQQGEGNDDAGNRMPLYVIRYPRGNRQRCEVCHGNISLNATTLSYRSRSVVRTIHLECTPNCRALYRPTDVGIDVIFHDAVANDEAEVDRVITTLSHLRSRRLMDRESELRRRRNNRRQQQQQQHGGGDLRIPDQAIMVGDIGRRMITFDNGLHEGILAYNWLIPGSGLQDQHVVNNMYHPSVAEALLRGHIPQRRGPPPPSIPAMMKKCTRVIIKKADIDPDTKDWRECTICLEPMKTRQAVIELPCEHRYHRGCIEKWFKTASMKDPTNVRCPLDKKSLFDMLGEPVPGA
ncbi:hypothetical protein Pmar_PMAR011105 [Perkinsus marinus ATCC 50983]|uniref:RING-type domain-containing protein n=1 Tax=Perkinsus marinus (strain ATCC 50983 / TXsc) TaxID=423536 RepID=C5KVQ4_PERM5|nr:hypothetical protein Pmar_PMAR011105 [Perkinsus marinus ATCC 50983]EER11439.1 hypothetical protein Pmar_PMAR011105 [Perkinsus marinus ATCC 50983]|eukprot:XP_002779644.1 hypothetical protein Pmar_PMAR011105 [Perkinsus marinus ATCC 50983]